MRQSSITKPFKYRASDMRLLPLTHANRRCKRIAKRKMMWSMLNMGFDEKSEHTAFFDEVRNKPPSRHMIGLFQSHNANYTKIYDTDIAPYFADACPYMFPLIAGAKVVPVCAVVPTCRNRIYTEEELRWQKKPLFGYGGLFKGITTTVTRHPSLEIGVRLTHVELTPSSWLVTVPDYYKPLKIWYSL